MSKTDAASDPLLTIGAMPAFDRRPKRQRQSRDPVARYLGGLQAAVMEIFWRRESATVREVADGDSDLVAARLCPQPGDHGLGQIYAVDAHPARGEGKGDTTGSDGELENRPPGCQLLQERNRFHLVTAGSVVVDACRVVVEARHRVVVLHRAPWESHAIRVLLQGENARADRMGLGPQNAPRSEPDLG